tara:strand:+ start:3286 stop:5505 length:2220 start_codon:yes stop_codon:yes gene_type:complete
MITNKIQTDITEDLLSGLDAEHIEIFYEYLEKIPMINRLVAADRKYAKDLEKDDKGRVVVQITHPHILEDMDYFTPAALYFQKHNCYTKLYPNKNPQSEYAIFWREERRRCLEGYVRESDGEWVSGYNYFYWNFAPIMKVIKVGDETDEGKVRSERIHDFANVWDSDYWYFHYVEQGEESGQYGKVLKTRGRGYSFKGGALDGRNAIHIKKSKSYSMAFEKEYLNKDGIFNKAIDVLDWNARHTPFPRLRLKDSQEKMHVILGYKDSELGINSGQLSEIMGVTLKDNPDKARGKRGKIIKWEEDGIFPGLKKAWGIARMSLEDGRNVFGYMISFGTGGTEGASFEASEEFFYHPGGYGILGIENVFDMNPSGECGMFIAEYMNKANCYDANGNSNVIQALVETLEDRQKIKREASDPNTIIQEMADRPITPQEAVMRREGSMFPVYELKQVKAALVTNNKLLDASWKGKMIVEKNNVTHKVSNTVKIVNKFPHSEQRPGGIEIFEHPITDGDGDIPRWRYIAGCDPVDDDGSGTNSLLSTFIMNTLTGDIVAEYTGRPQITEDYFEQQRLLLTYYNALMNYENNKKGLYVYFRNKNSLNLLCETPEILRDHMNITISKIGNKKFGTPASKSVNNYALGLIKKWLLTESIYQDEENPIEAVLNLHRLRSVPLLEELIAWHSDGNFDRVSALGMLMIFREDIHKLILNTDNKKVQDRGTDKFWFTQTRDVSSSYTADDFPI